MTYATYTDILNRYFERRIDVSIRLTVCLIGIPENIANSFANVDTPEGITLTIEPKSISKSTLEEMPSSHYDLIILNTEDLDIDSKQVIQLANDLDRNDLDSKTQLILITDSQSIESYDSDLCLFEDIWTHPITATEAIFRFSKWLHEQKYKAEAWQTAQFLDVALDSTPNLIWFKTKDGIHEKVNEAFCETVRKTKEQVHGQRHAYIWDVEQDDPQCIASEEEVMSTCKTCISEEVIDTADGNRILTTYKSPLYDIDGSVMGTVGIGVDITQEREFKNGLIEKNAALENIFTSLDCGIITHSIDGSKIDSINQAALDILGYETKEDLEEAGFHMVAPTVHIDDQEPLRIKISALKDKGDTTSVEYRVVRNDGSTTYVMGSVKLVEKDGELLYQRFLLDVTAQKLDEQVRQRRQRDIVNALASDYIVVCMFDLDTGEGSLIRLIDNDSQNILGKIFNDSIILENTMAEYSKMRIHEEEREHVLDWTNRNNLIDRLSVEQHVESIYQANLDGKTEYRQITFARTGDWPNKHLAVMGIKNVDAEIRDELEQKALLQESLVEMNAANEAKGNFLSNMSHDIRTPMNAIMGFTELALGHIDSKATVEDYLEKIKSSSAHLLDLINDILDMSRIESGVTELDEQACNMKSILENIKNMTLPEAQAHGITLEMDDAKLADTVIYCDKLKINQILLNLVSNAIKFTKGGGHVCVSLDDKLPAPHGFICYKISVKDNGIGMDESFLDLLFTPFERARTSTVSGIQGTGLGLAITKSLVELMNGTIEVQSQLGCGSTFTITLMFAIAENYKDNNDTDATIAVLDKLKGARLLLVEDNLFNQEIATTLLEDEGFVVECANDGIEAIESVERSNPGYYDFILMDIQMPNMNGYDAARAIRKLDNEALATIPIIALSADAFDSDRQKAIQSGMNGHVAKPIEISKLYKAINDAMSEED